MNAATIAELVLMFGPQAIQLVQQLTALWNKPKLDPAEVAAILDKIPLKTYADYLAEARAELAAAQKPAGN